MAEHTILTPVTTAAPEQIRGSIARGLAKIALFASVASIGLHASAAVAQTTSPPADAAPATVEDEGDGIIVTGIRGSLEKAAQIKRDSAQIVDVITAEDVGKLPDANVAVVVSGSGSVREHVQRLGRVLRKREGKRAVLYELVTEGTGEAFTSERRRDHSAYR